MQKKMQNKQLTTIFSIVYEQYYDMWALKVFTDLQPDIDIRCGAHGLYPLPTVSFKAIPGPKLIQPLIHHPIYELLYEQ